MFIKRTISVAILLPLVIWFILGASVSFFQLVSAIISLWAAWEWAELSGIKLLQEKLLYLVMIFAGLTIALFIPFTYSLYIGVIWWFFALGLLYQFSRVQSKRIIPWVSLSMGFFAIIAGWVGLNSLRGSPMGAHMLLFFLFLLWSTDTGAYLVGSRIGRRKLAPTISPGKSIEGFFGGLGMMLIVLIIGALLLRIPHHYWLSLVIVAIITNFFAVIGDLFESMLKRKAGVKDSGHVIPGHGGILDRLDSLLAAAPIFALGLLMIGLG